MKKLSCLTALVAVMFTLAAPVAEAQYRRSMTPPEGRFEMTMDGLQDGVSNIFLKGDERQCRILQRWNMTGEPCERVAWAHQSGYVAELNNRAARRAYYNGESMIPGSYGPIGGHGRVFANGNWFQSLGNGFFCKERPGENCYGKYDEAELYGTIIRESGNIFSGYLGHRRADKSLDQNFELSQREMDLKERRFEFKMEQERRGQAQQQAPVPVAYPTPTAAPAPVPAPTSFGTVLTNSTPDDILVTEQGKPSILLLAGESMSIENMIKVRFNTDGCDLRAPVKNNRGGVSITCATP